MITRPPGKPDDNTGATDYQLSRKIKGFFCRIAPKMQQCSAGGFLNCLKQRAEFRIFV